MTIQEILHAPAGEMLNAFMAVKVMGWNSKDCRERFPEVENWYGVGPGGAVAPTAAWSPSTTWIDASEVIDNWEGDFETHRNNGHWHVTFFLPSREYEAWGETMPLAVCRARLLTLT